MLADINRKYGARISPPDYRDFQAAGVLALDDTQDLPEEGLGRKHASPIYDQGDTSKCVAYTLREIKEEQEFKERGTFIYLDENFIFGNRHDDQPSATLLEFEGMYPRDAVANLVCDGVCKKGLIKESYAWYDMYSQFTDAIRADAKNYVIKQYAQIASDLEAQLAIKNFGSIAVSILVTPKFVGDYNELITPEYAKTNAYGGHMVEVIDWCIHNNKQYWVGVNSWGEGWGNYGGLFFLPFGYPFNERWSIADFIAPKPTKYFHIQCGAFSIKDNAQKLQKALKLAGFSTFIVVVKGLYKVQVGAFASEANADKCMEQLKAKGFKGVFKTFY